MEKIFYDPDVIRVAGLHHPKPHFNLSDLHEKEDSELFDPKKHEVAPANAHLVYNNGPLIANVEVFTVFWGKSWTTDASFIALATKINKFFTDILVSPLMDQMGEYSTPKYKIGHGKLTGTKSFATNAPAHSITDASIQTALKGWIANHTVPAPNANTLYFIYMDSGIKVQMGGGSSCSNFCGYHNDIANKTFYAVMPFPSCSGCLGGLTAYNALTATSSHELCEAITDPVPGHGWYDQQNGEIGDICAWQFKTVAGYTVQLEWSNKAKKCI